MTQARSLLVPANAHGIYHCISRCVRRAWLCGRDPLSGADHEHRRQWVEDRLEQLAGIYAVSVWAYAVETGHPLFRHRDGAQRRDIHFSNQSYQWLSPRRGAALRTALSSAIGVIFWVAAGM